MSTNKINFERSSQSNIKGFKDLDLFDDFIQSALDKYNFTPEIPKLDESAEKFHDYILNEESQIPDLIIYNKTFNKNDCFSGKFYFGFNKFPRKKFVLNAQNGKKDEENNNLEEKTNNTEAIINVGNKEDKESMKDNKDNDNKKDKNIQENEVKNEITNSMENNEIKEEENKNKEEKEKPKKKVRKKKEKEQTEKANSEPLIKHEEKDEEKKESDNKVEKPKKKIRKKKEKINNEENIEISKEKNEEEKPQEKEQNKVIKRPKKKRMKKSEDENKDIINNKQLEDKKENQENKDNQKEPEDNIKSKPKKFSNLEFVVESRSNQDNVININEGKNPKDNKKNIKPIYSIQEEHTSLCFVSENNINNVEDKKEDNQEQETNVKDKIIEPEKENIIKPEIIQKEDDNKDKSKDINENKIQEENEQKNVNIDNIENEQNKDIEKREDNNPIMNNIQNPINIEDGPKDSQNPKNNNIPTQQTMPMMFPPAMGMFPMNNQINFQAQNKLTQPMQPFLGFNQLDEAEDDDEPDPILDDDATDLNTISTFALMENTALIVKKNLVDKKWFLMRGDKVLGNYNSEQLLYFLTSQIQKGNKFEDMSINDHTTDLHFKPSILYDTLRKYVPKLKKRYLKKAIEQNNEIMKKMQQQQQILMQKKTNEYVKNDANESK